jgi:hypothetical protein
MRQPSTRSLQHNWLRLVLLLFGVTGLSIEAPIAQANETSINFRIPATEEVPAETMGQVTSVSQLSDVRADDWPFQALQSLVERYACIVGYPDRTFRGQRAITRYEFAAGLNACIDRVNELIAAGKQEIATKEDLATLQKLQTEFAAELATVRGRVDGLEGKVATLEKQQFSTTTKLFGQVIFGLQGRSVNQADLNPRNGIKETLDPNSNISFGYNTQLSLLTQFDQRSFMLLGLQAGNLSTGAGNNNLPYFLNDSYTRLAYETNTQNQVILSDATYRFAPTRKLAVVVGAIGVSPVTVFRGPNRYESAGQGPVSAFAQRNPILNVGGGQTGVGLDWQVSDRLSVQAVYAAGNSAANPAVASGLFNGPNTVGVQIAALPLPKVDWTAYYLRSYTTNAFLNTGLGDDLIGFVGSRFTTNAIGTTVSWRVTPGMTFGGWVGYTNSTVKVPTYSGGVSTLNWMAFANFPDFLGRGNLAGLYFGQPPKIGRSDLAVNGVSSLNIPATISGLNGIAGGQPDTTYHLEAFYRMRLTDQLSLTPGVVVLFNPVQTQSSDTIVIGTLRTTFSF